MARKKKPESTKRFYNVFAGTFRQRLKEAQEGSITRVNKNNVAVHEMEFGELEGVIKKCYTYEHDEYGFMLVIELQDEENTEVIETSMKSGFASTFMNRLMNVDLGKPVTLQPYDFTPKGEEKAKKGVIVKQAGKKVEPKFTKENPGDLPPMKQITKGANKGKWDSAEQEEYWIEKLGEITAKLSVVTEGEGVKVEAGE